MNFTDWGGESARKQLCNWRLIFYFFRFGLFCNVQRINRPVFQECMRAYRQKMVTICVIICAFAANAWNNTIVAQNGPIQRGSCDTIFFEDFEDQAIDAAWQNLDLDMENPSDPLLDSNWMFIYDSLSTTFLGDSNHVAAATSFFSPPGQASNWLITDSFTVCDSNLWLVWKSAPDQGFAFMDGYEVLLSTTDSMPGSFTQLLAKFAEGWDGFPAIQIPGLPHPNFCADDGVMTQWRTSLKPYYGQRVFIAFHHDSEDDNMIFLDDILVAKLPQYDVGLDQADYSSEYSRIPISQAPPLVFSARVRNHGTDTLTNVKVAVNVTESGVSAYQDTLTLAILPPEKDSIVNLPNPFTPSNTGNYMAGFKSWMDQADAEAGNDTAKIGFEISDTTLARDNGILNGSLSIGGTPGILGNRFEIVTTDTVTSVSFRLFDPSPGDSVYASIMPFNIVPLDSQTFAETVALNVTSSADSTYTLGFPNGVGHVLQPGQYFVGIHERAQDQLTLAYASHRYAEEGGYRYRALAWKRLEKIMAVDFLGVLMVRLNFGHTDTIVSRYKGLADANIDIYPNPFENELIISSKDVDQLMRFELLDVLGRVHREGIIRMDSDRRFRLDLSALRAGNYLLRLHSAQGTYSKVIYKRK